MNNLRTTLFLGLLTGLVMAVGYLVGGRSGVLTALAISVIFNFSAYWWSDKIVLKTYGAIEADKNKYSGLYQTMTNLTAAAGLPLPKLYLMESALPNAFATGRNENHAVVAVTTGLLQQLNPAELSGVLAHELSHIKNKDILIGSLAATFAGAISYLTQFAYLGNFSGLSDSEDNNGKGMASALLMMVLAPLIATLLHLAISRSREYLADESGAKITNNPEGLASALAKISNFTFNHQLHGSPKQETAAHLFIINPFKPSFLMTLFTTHPPVEERIKKLQTMR
ncbi:MAG TPA: zinc metalloprotease HtpX [bacterium]|nr:zinc metalloprotease HtpX [bacterium]